MPLADPARDAIWREAWVDGYRECAKNQSANPTLVHDPEAEDEASRLMNTFLYVVIVGSIVAIIYLRVTKPFTPDPKVVHNG